MPRVPASTRPLRMRRAVIDLTSTQPVWSVPDSVVRRIARAFGRGWEVVAVTEASPSDGDGAGGSAAGVRAAAGAEAYLGWGVAPAVVAASRSALRWAHTAAAGAGGSITPAFVATRAVLTNSRGILAEPMADWAVAAIGFCLRGFHEAVAAQRARRWAKPAFTDGSVPVRELAGTRIGIVGLGGIGAAVARRCARLGMEVRGVRRRPERRRPAGVRWVGGPNDLSRLARMSDILVITAPHTGATRRVVDGAVLDALPPGAFVLNLSRGALLDEDALLARLEAGRIRGCVLDVLSEEPPPAHHPFWEHPRVLLTPHVSGVSQRFWERESALILENVRRYRAGRRLRNVVDLHAGY